MAATDKRGLTLIELIVCTLIIGILSTTALPIARNVVRKQKEALLLERLSDMRKAIDRYYARQVEKQSGLEDWQYYPENLGQLVESKLLRKIPLDPFTEKADWKTRSSNDEAATVISNMVNVFDVFSSSPDHDLKGKPYSEW